MDKIVEKIFNDIEIVFIDFLKSKEIEKEVYACGFWLFYCDHMAIRAPSFAYNSAYEDQDDRWCPPEWDVDTDYTLDNSIKPFYESITILMEGKSDDDWEELVAYQWQFYTDICKRLNSEIDIESSPFKNWPKSKDFVIGIFEDRENMYVKLAIDSLGREKAKELRVI